MLDCNTQKLEKVFKKNKVVFAYLFGSQASGKTGLMSDIDIAVYFDNNLNSDKRFNQKFRLMADLSNLLKKEEIDVVPLNDAYPLLAHRILKYGKIIYCEDIKQEKNYQDRAIGEYLDWQPYLEEQARQLFT